MTHLINDEAVCRTAPATPGLLKIVQRCETKVDADACKAS